MFKKESTTFCRLAVDAWIVAQINEDMAQETVDLLSEERLKHMSRHVKSMIPLSASGDDIK